MKNILTYILIILSTLSYSITKEESDLVNEINSIRKNPKSYIPKVEDYIIKQKKLMLMVGGKLKVNIKSNSGVMSKDNTMVNSKTLVGVDVLKRNINSAEELILVLEGLEPMDTLKFSYDMYPITVKHGNYLKEENTLGHYGPKGETLYDRFNSNEVSENCGTSLISLMVDSGVENRGHRKNILDPDWGYISVFYIKNHPTWGNKSMVQNFSK